MGQSKRSVVIAGHATSVSLEEEFWQALKAIAEGDQVTLSHLIETLDSERQTNLSSALRLFVLRRLQERIAGKPVPD
jgi:predicted DNA-binding ribbon-helix-helix protein